MSGISVDQVITRLGPLKEAGTINAIGGLGDVKDAPENTLVTDSVFVMPPTKRAGDNRTGTSRVDQKVTELIGIGIVFLGIGAAGGAEQTTHIQAVCDAVEGNLLGWVPGAGLSPLTLVSAGAEDVNTVKGYLIYSFVFQTSYHARKP